MNLHDVPTVPPGPIFLDMDAINDADEEEDEFRGQCPECGSWNWTRFEQGWKTEHHRLTFNTRGHVEREDWDINDEGINDTEPWKCYECDYVPGDIAQDWINDNR